MKEMLAKGKLLTVVRDRARSGLRAGGHLALDHHVVSRPASADPHTLRLLVRTVHPTVLLIADKRHHFNSSPHLDLFPTIRAHKTWPFRLQMTMPCGNLQATEHGRSGLCGARPDGLCQRDREGCTLGKSQSIVIWTGSNEDPYMIMI